MKKLALILRYTLNTIFLLLVLGTCAVYVTIHFNLLGKVTKDTVTPLLSDKLNTDVAIESVEINWFNQAAMNNVVIYDQMNDTLLYVRRATISFELLPLLEKKLNINAVQLIEFDIHIRQESLDSDPNFKFIVDALAPKEKNKRKFINDMNLNVLNLRRGKLSYQLGKAISDKTQEQQSAPTDYFPFTNYQDLHINDITASMKIVVSHITGLDVNVRRFSFSEQQGLDVEGICTMKNDSLHVECSKIIVDCPLPGYVDMEGLADITLTNPEQAEYDLHINKAQVYSSSIVTLSEIYGFQLPEIGNIWNDSEATLSLEGQIRGTGAEEVLFEGAVQTQGSITASTNIKASYQKTNEHPIYAEIDGYLKSFPYNHYTYRNIQIEASTNGQDVKARFRSNDPECNAYGKAELTRSDRTYLIDFDTHINHISPDKLHLSSWDNFSGLSMAAHAKGNLHIQQKKWPLGDVRLDSLSLMSASDTLPLQPIQIALQHEENTWVGVFKSSFLNFAGTQTTAFAYLSENQALSKMLKLPIYLSKDATFVAEWDSVKNAISVEGNIPEIKSEDGTINAIFSASGTTKDHSPMPTDLKANIAFDYITPKHMFSAAMVSTIKPSPLWIQFENADISIDGHPFSSEGATLSQSANGTYTLSGFSLRNGEQELSINGFMRNKEDMRAQLHANDLQIDFFLDMLGKNYLDFGGYASGDILLDADSILHLETNNLAIRDFTYIDHELGTNKLSAYYDLTNRNLYVDADIENNGNHSYGMGEVRIGPPGVNTYIDLTFDINQLPIDFADYWVGGFLHDLHGTGKGKARLFGDTKHLNLVGRPTVDANFTHSLLGARFYLRDTINFSATGDSLEVGMIQLNDAHVYDRDGQLAHLDVNVTHNYLSKFNYDANIVINPSANGFLLYDHPNQRAGELYWGQLFGTGRCQIHGSTQTSRHRIGLQMEPAGKSVLYLSPGEANFSESAYNFLSFRDKATLTYHGDEWDMLSRVHTNIKEENTPTYIEADLQVHANEHCLVNMQMDPLAEDRLLCRGTGDITLHYDSNHDLNITGNYDINQGTYTITMKGDVMTKSFQLQSGSRVSFSGVPSEADLNLNAVYNIHSANLKDLDESFATVTSLSRTTLPVDCKLFVAGSLAAPQITFDLNVKNVSDDVQALVHNIIGTQEMLNREVFYLLLFGKFYTPEYASTSTNNTNSGLSSFASATLTSQLNNLLGHMSDNFTLGTNFYSEKGDFTDIGMDLSMQTRLFSDRLLLSGNLSYRDPSNRVGLTNSNTSFFGDFDVEYLINSSGTLRAKAYSHYNERYYNINNSLTTQGIGIVIRKDLKTLKELLPWQAKYTK